MRVASQSLESSSPETVRWRVELFGSLRARRLDAAGADETIDSFSTQKTGSLLACLVLEQRMCSRDWLAEVIWPGSAPEAGRNSLRVSLSLLRKTFSQSEKDGRVLRATNKEIGIGEAITSDYMQYREATRRAEREEEENARIAALEAAFHQVGGQFLRGLYDDWAVDAARRFEEEFLAVARRVIAAHENNDDWLRALDCARHAAMVVPDSDVPLRDLVRIGLRAGESVSVKRTFDTWKKRRQQSGLDDTPNWQDFVSELSAPAPAAATGSRVPPPAINQPEITDQKPAPTSSGTAPQTLQVRALPVPASSFIGRDREREQIGGLLSNPATRLVTVLGAGGAGKTRLSLEVAHEAHERDIFEAVAWVGAASLGTLRAVQNTMFDALGLPVDGSDLQALQKAVRQSVLGQQKPAKRTLIVFDNFEHLGEAGAVWLGELLQCAPGVVALVTSRLALQTAGEYLWPLSPLPATHTDADNQSRGNLTSSGASSTENSWPDAVRLFVERAAQVRAGFAPSPAEVEDIALICEALGGSPLAIEVAAARLTLFSPTQLAQQLGGGESAPQEEKGAKAKAPVLRRDGLFLERVEEPKPTSPDRISPLDWPNRDVSAPARHRTLREAIAWSARQLPPRARAFWVRLSVFRGAFEMDAASEICEEPHAAALLLSLRDSSLLTLHTEGDVVRASWNEALREFAQELLSPEEKSDMIARHAAFFARRAREAGEIVGRGEGGRPFGVFGADGPPPQSKVEHERVRARVRRAREELDAARADLRSAFELFLNRDPLVALDMGVHLWPAWGANKRLAEGRALLQRALEAAPVPTEEAPDEEQRAAWSAAWTMRARALEGVGALMGLSYELLGARQFFEEARRAFERAGDADGVTRTLSAGGLVALQGGDLVAARALSEQSLSSQGEQQNATRRNALYNLSLVAIMSGDLASVRALASEGLMLHQAQNDRHGIALCLENLGQVALFQDELATARVYFETARSQFEALDEDAGRARAWWGLGHVARKSDEFSEARACFERSVRISGAQKHSWALPYQLEAFALLAGQQQQWARATRLLEGARRIRREEGTPLPQPFFAAELTQLRVRCQKAMGQGLFEAQSLTNEALSHEALIALINA